MNTLPNIRDTLSAIARTGATLKTMPEFHAADDTLRYVAKHIDRTVLARHLQFTLPDHTHVQCDVQNRRLLRYSVTVNRNNDGHSDRAPDQFVCSPEDGETVSQNLRTLFAHKALQKLRIVDDPTIILPITPGVSASTILRTIDADAPPKPLFDLESCIAEFVESAPERILGAVVIRGEDIVAIHGSDEQLFAMLDWLNAAFGGSALHDFSGRSDLEMGGICAVDWCHPTPRSLLIARTPKQACLILVEECQNSNALVDLKAHMAS